MKSSKKSVKLKLIFSLLHLLLSLPISALNKFKFACDEPIAMSIHEKALWAIGSTTSSQCFVIHPVRDTDLSFQKENSRAVAFWILISLVPLDIAVSKECIWLICKDRDQKHYLCGYHKASIPISEMVSQMSYFREPKVKHLLSGTPKHIRCFEGKVFVSYLDLGSIVSYDEKELVSNKPLTDKPLTETSHQVYPCPGHGKFRIFDNELWVCHENAQQIDVYDLKKKERIDQILLEEFPSDIVLTDPYAYIRYRNIPAEEMLAYEKSLSTLSGHLAFSSPKDFDRLYKGSRESRDSIDIFNRATRKYITSIDVRKIDSCINASYVQSSYRLLEVSGGALWPPYQANMSPWEHFSAVSLLIPLFLDARISSSGANSLDNALMRSHLRARLTECSLSNLQDVQKREGATMPKSEIQVASEDLFHKLPLELFHEVLNEFSIKDQMSLRSVSKYFKSVIEECSCVRDRLRCEWMVQSLYGTHADSKTTSESKDIFKVITNYLYALKDPLLFSVLPSSQNSHH